MAKQVFEPWFAVKVGARKNSKILALPNDTARLGWFLGVLAEAKQQRPGGRFVSRDQLLESIPGRFAEHIDDYVRLGLLHQAPRLCPDCRKDLGNVAPGTLVVHDWRKHQRDPNAPIRSALWREEHADEEPRTPEERTTNDDSDGPDDDFHHMDIHSGESGRSEHETTPRTLDERSENAGRTLAERATNELRTPSRERARGLAIQGTDTDTETGERIGSSDVGYPAPGAAEPLLTERQLSQWRPFRRHQWDGFRAAWFARGFKLPPAGDPDDPRSQAHVVWEILDNRGDELATWVAEAPGKTSHAVVAHLIERWQAIKADAGVDDEALPDVDADPTSTPESAREVLARMVSPDWLATVGKREPVEAER